MSDQSNSIWQVDISDPRYPVIAAWRIDGPATEDKPVAFNQYDLDEMQHAMGIHVWAPAAPEDR